MNARQLRSRDEGRTPALAPRPIRLMLVGGMTRLDSFYREAPPGVEIDAAYLDCPSLETRAEAADAIVLVVAHVSHAASGKVRNVVRRRGIPLASATSASVSRVRAAIELAHEAVRNSERVSGEWPTLRAV